LSRSPVGRRFAQKPYIRTSVASNSLSFGPSYQIFARNWFPMHEDCGDTVVRIHTFQWRLLQQHQIGDLSRLDRPHLRIKFELPRVIDRRGFEDLRERHSGFLQLLHLEISVSPRQIAIGRRRRRIGAEQKIRILAARYPTTSCTWRNGPCSRPSYTVASGESPSLISFLNHLPSGLWNHAVISLLGGTFTNGGARPLLFEQ